MSDDLYTELREVLHVQSWKSLAACSGFDPNIWFPERGESLASAKAICRQCDVQAECLAYAMNNAIHHGVWGGQSERERRRIRRARSRADGRLGPPPPIAHGTTEAMYRRCLEEPGGACDACRTKATAAARLRLYPESSSA